MILIGTRITSEYSIPNLKELQNLNPIHNKRGKKKNSNLSRPVLCNIVDKKMIPLNKFLTQIRFYAYVSVVGFGLFFTCK